MSMARPRRSGIQPSPLIVEGVVRRSIRHQGQSLGGTGHPAIPDSSPGSESCSRLRTCPGRANVDAVQVTGRVSGGRGPDRCQVAA